MSALGRLRTRASFDHLVGRNEDRSWHRYSERLGRFDIDEQFELGCLHDWQIGRLLTLQNTADIKASLTVRVREAGAVAYQSTCDRVFTPRVQHGHRMTLCQRHDVITPSLVKWVGCNQQR